MRFRERMIRFMQGRYGADALSRFLLGVAIALILISMFTKGTVHSILYWASLLLIGYGYFRMLSRDFNRRYQENAFYLKKTEKIRFYLSQQKRMMAQRKTHHIDKCPGCSQKIRVPRGKGRIEISCPKCRTKFIKRS